jgi:hypothetical protein
MRMAVVERVPNTAGRKRLSLSAWIVPMDALSTSCRRAVPARRRTGGRARGNGLHEHRACPFGRATGDPPAGWRMKSLAMASPGLRPGKRLTVRGAAQPAAMRRSFRLQIFRRSLWLLSKASFSRTGGFRLVGPPAHDRMALGLPWALRWRRGRSVLAKLVATSAGGRLSSADKDGMIRPLAGLCLVPLGYLLPH